MPYPNPADIADLQADPNLTVEEQEGLNVNYLAYNTKVPPFDKTEVRKALNMAINKAAIIDAVYQGAGAAAINPIPPTMWSYNTAVQDDPYDPEGAKKMLADAGVTDLSMKIWAMPVSRPYNPNAQRMAEMLQADFAAVGVKAEIVTMEWAEYLAQSRRWIATVRCSSAGPATTAIGQLLAVLLAVTRGRQQPWWARDFEADPGNSSPPIGRAPALRTGAGDLQRAAPWATIASKVFMPMSNKVSGFVMDPLGIHR